MLVSQSHGVAILKPLNQDDLAQWHPSPEAPWQLVAVSDHEFQLFHTGTYLGTATRIRGTKEWQASSSDGEVCIAPLPSPFDCALRLLERETSA